MEQKIFQVDSFTNTPFSGNPAGVCLLEEPADEQWMQQVANEMNLSETAFLYRYGDSFKLRWFTPKIEVDLCGHATLASAHILWQEGILPRNETAVFSTRSGELTAVSLPNNWIELNFPAKLEEEEPKPPAELIQALGVTPLYVGKNQFDYLIEVATPDEVVQLKPDFGALSALPVRGVMVTSWAGHSEYDFVSRFFAPGSGIEEDPVTGSAHCCLGPFWAKRMRCDNFVAYQASTRGGIVHVRMEDDRVYLGGQAVTVFSGEVAKKEEKPPASREIRNLARTFIQK